MPLLSNWARGVTVYFIYLVGGDPVEYAISAGVVIVCIGLSHITGGQGFAPFFYDWAGMYEQGLIDALEWKANRFRLI
ncbi:hypothetical protein DSB67_25520 (plasmid) [Vibrio campbellii]|nr:hypothetical protein DSB67_25520 [Vibrio campbellii]